MVQEHHHSLPPVRPLTTLPFLDCSFITSSRAQRCRELPQAFISCGQQWLVDRIKRSAGIRLSSSLKTSLGKLMMKAFLSLPGAMTGAISPFIRAKNNVKGTWENSQIVAFRGGDSTLSWSGCCVVHDDRESPSRKEGIPPEVEFRHRLFGCEVIQEAGILLRQPQVCHWSQPLASS